MQVKFISDGHGQGQLYLDGQKIDGVVSIEVKSRAQEVNSVIIELIPSHIDLELSEANIEMKESEINE